MNFSLWKLARQVSLILNSFEDCNGYSPLRKMLIVNKFAAQILNLFSSSYNRLQTMSKKYIDIRTYLFKSEDVNFRNICVWWNKIFHMEVMQELMLPLVTYSSPIYQSFYRIIYLRIKD